MASPTVSKLPPQGTTTPSQAPPLADEFSSKLKLDVHKPKDSASVPSIPSAPDFDIRYGFLPHRPPLHRLPAPWSAWEDALEAAKGMAPGYGESKNKHTGRWRKMIREELKVIQVGSLRQDTHSLRRAHLVLVYLVHFYTNSDTYVDTNTPKQLLKVPRSLAIPLCTVSDILELPPVVNYADIVLYNWELVNPDHGMIPSNIQVPLTFTATEDEKHFYKSFVLVETQAPRCLSLMKGCLDEAAAPDEHSLTKIANNLTSLGQSIEDIRGLLEKIRDGCEPAVFFWGIKPWWNTGPREMDGVKDPGDEGKNRVVDFGGPGGGQSTLIHALDAFLGDYSSGTSHDHHHSGGPAPCKQPSNASSENFNEVQSFMGKAMVHMPPENRQFLQGLKALLHPSSKKVKFPGVPDDQPVYSIRSLALACPPDSALRRAYNQTINSLVKFRSSHINVVTLYVVSQSRVEPPPDSAFLPFWHAQMRKKAEESAAGKKSEGADLTRFLKLSRKRTAETVI